MEKYSLKAANIINAISEVIVLPSFETSEKYQTIAEVREWLIDKINNDPPPIESQQVILEQIFKYIVEI